MRQPQTTMGERTPGFDVDTKAARRGRAFIDVVLDAMERRHGSLEAAAAVLDAVFGPEGRPVSGTLLRACARQAERNYFRAEWVVIVADDPEVVAFFASFRRTPAEELAALREHMAKNARGELERFDVALARKESRRG